MEFPAWEKGHTIGWRLRRDRPKNKPMNLNDVGDRDLLDNPSFIAGVEDGAASYELKLMGWLPTAYGSAVKELEVARGFQIDARQVEGKS